jgi:hypothetical protein
MNIDPQDSGIGRLTPPVACVMFITKCSNSAYWRRFPGASVMDLTGLGRGPRYVSPRPDDGREQETTMTTSTMTTAMPTTAMPMMQTVATNPYISTMLTNPERQILGDAPGAVQFFQLGMMYATGHSVPAKDAVRLRHEIAAELSAAEIVIAQRAARAWLARN